LKAQVSPSRSLRYGALALLVQQRKQELPQT